MTHPYVWQYSFICVKWLIHVCDIFTYSSVCSKIPRCANEEEHIMYTRTKTRACLSYMWHERESCHTYEWVMSHTWMRHVTHMNETCHTYAWVMSHIGTKTRACLSYVWHDLFFCVAWLIYVCDTRLLEERVMAWRIHMWDMAHSCMWHVSIICVASLIHMCVMTHSYACHDSFIRVTWRIHIRDMPHLYVWNDAYIHVLQHTTTRCNTLQ